MTFASPIWFLGLLPVAAVAVVVFLRPAQREVVVGSLALWLQAIRSVGDAGARVSRRIPPGWAMLLAGAILAVLALCEPVLHWPTPDTESATQPPVEIPAISFDALAGCSLPDGRVEVLARLHNTSKEPFAGTLTITPQDATSLSRPIAIPANDSVQAILFTLHAEMIHVEVKNTAGDVQASADLQNIPAAVTHVAVMGNALSALQRYIQADPRLMLVADAAQADVVIAQGVLPPNNKAALVLAPPMSMPGGRESVTFASADIAADDPVMRDVNVAAMAVRRVTPMLPGSMFPHTVLLSLDSQPIIMRTTPERDPASDTPWRVYVAFEISRDNTNIDDIPAPYITLLANAIRWLCPADGERGRYVCEDISDEIAAAAAGALGVHEEAPTSEKTRLKVPRDLSRLHSSLELRPFLIVAAMVCWIAGWRRMGRKVG